VSAPRFVVDTMLGRLAHWLRAMGYDTLYFGPADDARLLELARVDDRVLVTRDARLAALAGGHGCRVRGERVDAQLEEIVETLALVPPDAEWLSRCLECNRALERREPDDVRTRVPQRVFATHTEFRGCPGCGRVYWAGSHFDRIRQRLERLVHPARRATREPPPEASRDSPD
jgi:uncharacterized protein